MTKSNAKEIIEMIGILFDSDYLFLKDADYDKILNEWVDALKDEPVYTVEYALLDYAEHYHKMPTPKQIKHRIEYTRWNAGALYRDQIWNMKEIGQQLES